MIVGLSTDNLAEGTLFQSTLSISTLVGPPSRLHVISDFATRSLRSQIYVCLLQLSGIYRVPWYILRGAVSAPGIPLPLFFVLY